MVHLSLRIIALILITFYSSYSNEFSKSINITSSDSQNFCKFIENKGQWHKDIKYLAKGNGVNLWVTSSNLIFDFYSKEYLDIDESQLSSHEKMFLVSDNRTVHKVGNIVAMDFLNSNRFNSFVYENPSIGVKNYFLDNNPDNWTIGVKEYESVIINNVYDGIDIQLTFNDGFPRYDFIISENADPNNIQFKFSGVDEVKVENNSLILKVKNQEIYNTDIVAYQQNPNEFENINCSFKTKGDYISFELGNYNKEIPLVIDPLIFSTYLGGLDDDKAYGIDLDNYNNIIVTGYTISEDFPVVEGSYDVYHNHLKDAFISKYTIQGTTKSLVFSTFFGGSDVDESYGVATDNEGNIYITGLTSSSDFPLVKPIYANLAGGSDAFIAKFNPDGNEIIYSSVIGGNKDDYGLAIDVGSSGSAYITGGTNSTNIPYNTMYNNGESGNKGLEELFVTKVVPSGNQVDFTSLVTSGGSERGNAICVIEALDFVLIGGQTDNARFQTKPNTTPYRVFDRYYNSGVDGVLLKFGISGGVLSFSSFFGGFNDDKINAVALDESGNFFFAGRTNSKVSSVDPLINSESKDFPILNTSYDQNYNGEYDGFFGKFDSKCQTLMANTYFGGKQIDDILAIAINPKTKTVFFTGNTNSSDYPIINVSDVPKVQGISDIIIGEFNSIGNEPQYSNLLGANRQDVGTGITFDSQGEMYLTGYTSSTNFPTSFPTQKTNGGGDFDAFVMKYTNKVLTLVSPQNNDDYCGGRVLTFSWNTTDFPSSDKFKIELSSDNGVTWSLIKDEVTGSKYDWSIPKDMTHGNLYKARISHYSGIEITNTGTFKIVDAGILYSITTAPENLNICEGNSVSFAAHTNGIVTEFQWRHNGVNIEGATDSVLILTNLTLDKSGSYDLVFEGQCINTSYSSKLTLSVLPKTNITSQSNDTTIKKDASITLKVVTVGAELQYEWYRNGSKILAANESTYKITNAQKIHEGYYVCYVYGRCERDTSKEIRLVVDTTTVNVFESENSTNNNLKIRVSNDIIQQDNIIITIESVNECNIQLDLMDNYGRYLVNLYEGFIEEGINQKKIDLSEYVNGVYWIVAQCGENKVVKKINIVR